MKVRDLIFAIVHFVWSFLCVKMFLGGEIRFGVKVSDFLDVHSRYTSCFEGHFFSRNTICRGTLLGRGTEVHHLFVQVHHLFFEVHFFKRYTFCSSFFFEVHFSFLEVHILFRSTSLCWSFLLF